MKRLALSTLFWLPGQGRGFTALATVRLPTGLPHRGDRIRTDRTVPDTGDPGGGTSPRLHARPGRKPGQGGLAALFLVPAVRGIMQLCIVGRFRRRKAARS